MSSSYKPHLEIYWHDPSAQYRYRLYTYINRKEKVVLWLGDYDWAERQSKHYGIKMPKVEET